MTDLEANLKLAASLAQDRGTRVTLIVPRAAGLLNQARAAATAEGVDVVAERVGGASITLKFQARPPEPAPQPTRRGAWAWLSGLFGAHRATA